MVRLIAVWHASRGGIGRHTEEPIIAEHVRDRLVPLVEVLQWLFALDEHFRSCGGSYVYNRALKPAGQVLRGLSLMRNLAAHQLAALLGWWWVPIDTPEDWAERSPRIETVPVHRDGAVGYEEAAYVDGFDVPVAFREDSAADWVSCAGRMRRLQLAWRAWEELPDVPSRHQVKEGDERLRYYRERLQGRDALMTVQAAAEFLKSRP